MLNERLSAAKKIASELHQAEDAIDETMIRIAQLAASLPTARRDINMSAIVGQEAMAKVAHALAAAGEVRQLLTDAHIAKIIKTYQFRDQEPRYARRVDMAEIEKNDFNLNISRYISTATAEEEIDLPAVNAELVALEQTVEAARAKHNAFLKELGLPLLP